MKRKFQYKSFSISVVCLGPFFFKTFLDLFSFIGEKTTLSIISILSILKSETLLKDKKKHQTLAPSLVLFEDWIVVRISEHLVDSFRRQSQFEFYVHMAKTIFCCHLQT